jgi:uncharacterized membrane protein (DUF373 family)
MSQASDPAPPGAGPATGGRQGRLRGVAGSIWVLEHAQDILAITVGALLVGLAAALLVSGVVRYVPGVVSFTNAAGTQSVPKAAVDLLDRILLVLILVEIVHTVVLSLREHRLAAQPFIVVGLVAVIRRILFMLSDESHVNDAELGLLIAMVVVFIAGLIAIRHFDRREDLPVPQRDGKPPVRPVLDHPAGACEDSGKWSVEILSLAGVDAGEDQDGSDTAEGGLPGWPGLR